MPSEIVVALLALIGTLGGSFGGIMAANKLTTFRIEQLEKKVDKHNQVVERTLVIERDLETAFGKIDESRADIRRIEERLEHHYDN